MNTHTVSVRYHSILAPHDLIAEGTVQCRLTKAQVVTDHRTYTQTFVDDRKAQTPPHYSRSHRFDRKTGRRVGGMGLRSWEITLSTLTPIPTPST